MSIDHPAEFIDNMSLKVESCPPKSNQFRRVSRFLSIYTWLCCIKGLIKWENCTFRTSKVDR